MKKTDLKNITNVKKGYFELNGEKWEMSNHPKNEGFSQNGIWNEMTNGTVTKRIYKKDVIEYAGFDVAKKLFGNEII